VNLPGWIKLSGLLAISCLMHSCATPVGAACQGEAEKARLIRDRIENELPLRHSDPVTDYVRAFGLHLAERAGVAGKADWRFAVVRDLSVNAFSIGMAAST